MTALPPIAVIGAGAFGTALAIVLARNGNAVRLWGRDPQAMARIGETRENQPYLPGHTLPESIATSADLDASLNGVDNVLVVVPSHAFRATLSQLAARPLAGISWATKGLDPGRAKPLNQAAEEILGDNPSVAVLSGPTFANEIASGLPTAVCLAGHDPQHLEHLAGRLHRTDFRVYLSDDPLGVCLGGAVKNVLAIAAGIADGLGFGANTRAALITRGLSEMTRLAEAAGGRRETLNGLAGLGDLVLTCTDDQSRNRRMGLGVARGASPEKVARDIGQVVEGVNTAAQVMRLATRLGIDMPIVTQVYRVLHEGLPPTDAVRELLARDGSRPETG